MNMQSFSSALSLSFSQSSSKFLKMQIFWPPSPKQFDQQLLYPFKSGFVLYKKCVLGTRNLHLCKNFCELLSDFFVSQEILATVI
jgi:hypothetical protein